MEICFNSFLASHLDATGFYRQLLNVYLDLCFALAAVAADAVWRVSYLRSHLLINKLLWLSLLSIQSILFQVEMIVSVVNISDYRVTISLLWTDFSLFKLFQCLPRYYHTVTVFYPITGSNITGSVSSPRLGPAPWPVTGPRSPQPAHGECPRAHLAWSWVLIGRHFAASDSRLAPIGREELWAASDPAEVSSCWLRFVREDSPTLQKEIPL